MEQTINDYKLIPLNSSISEVEEFYSIKPTDKDDEYLWEENENKIHFKFRDNELIQVIYNLDCNRNSDEEINKKLNVIFDFYDNSNWNQILDNGFGLTFISKDKKLRGMWSYVCDVITVMYHNE